jgi:hypothetical protein
MSAAALERPDKIPAASTSAEPAAPDAPMSAPFQGGWSGAADAGRAIMVPSVATAVTQTIPLRRFMAPSYRL